MDPRFVAIIFAVVVLALLILYIFLSTIKGEQIQTITYTPVSSLVPKNSYVIWNITSRGWLSIGSNGIATLSTNSVNAVPLFYDGSTILPLFTSFNVKSELLYFLTTNNGAITLTPQVGNSNNRSFILSGAVNGNAAALNVSPGRSVRVSESLENAGWWVFPYVEGGTYTIPSSATDTTLNQSGLVPMVGARYNLEYSTGSFLSYGGISFPNTVALTLANPGQVFDFSPSNGISAEGYTVGLLSNINTNDFLGLEIGASGYTGTVSIPVQLTNMSYLGAPDFLLGVRSQFDGQTYYIGQNELLLVRAIPFSTVLSKPLQYTFAFITTPTPT